jgi:hypothetical protein
MILPCNPLVPSGNLYYIAGSFGNLEIAKVVSDHEFFDCPDLYSTQEEDNEVTKKVDECLLVYFDR